MDRIQLIAVLGTLGLFLTVLELVRRRRLLERYAVLWLFCAAILVLLAVWKGLLTSVGHELGFAVPANALFVVALGFVLVLLLHFSLAVSRLAEQSKVLAQRLALLQERLAQAEAEAEPAPEPRLTALGGGPPPPRTSGTPAAAARPSAPPD
jgi:hypothetical protein